MAQRGRAWRRAQRERCLAARADRMPEPKAHFYTCVYRLHTPGGIPTSLYKRQQIKRTPNRYRPLKAVEGADVVVSVRHEYGCPHYKPLHYYGPKVAYTPTSGVCACTKLKPGGLADGWPPAPLGYVWKCIRIALTAEKPYAPGKFAKGRKAHDPLRPMKVHVKKWKLMYSRSSKARRAKQLGFNYPRKVDVQGS